MVDWKSLKEIVFYSEEDKGWIDHLMKYPTISTFGLTKEEAVEEMKDVKKALIEIEKAESKKELCPLCGKDSMNVIYYGLPHYLCEDNKCSCLWGWPSILTQYLPFNGCFYVCNNGYWNGLYHWLTENFDDGGIDE